MQYAVYCPLLSLIFCPGAIQQCAALLGQQPAICEGEPPRQSPARLHELTYSTPAYGHISAQGKAKTLCGHRLKHHVS